MEKENDMMRYTRSFVGLLIFLAISAEGLAGLWTTNEFIYKPAIGDRGQTSKDLFDAGLDRIDARLGEEIWVGDPLHLTLDSILADETVTSGTIVVPAGTHTLSAISNRTLATGLNLRVLKGCLISIPTGRTFPVNGTVESGPYQIIIGAGTVTWGNIYPRYNDWVGTAGGQIRYNTVSTKLEYYNGAEWGDIGSECGGGTWGSITGTITGQTDLINLLGGINIPSATEFGYVIGAT
jgi:hypothetical protein